MAFTHFPLIGITMGHNQNAKALTYELGEAYLQAVIKAGGLPIILPSGLPEEILLGLLKQCDALLLTGGGDIDPLSYQKMPDDRAGGIDLRRDASEHYLIKAAMLEQMPILGICRGIQMLNVALGGTLYPDINGDMPGTSKHDFYPDLPRDAYCHTISIEEGNLFHEIMGKTEIQVNSLHHQGVKDPADGLVVVGRPEDGTIEAIIAPDYSWCIAVQWHPECLSEDIDAQNLFTAFVNAANQYKRVK
jgi:putative glutamine amidotransferase